MKRRGARGGAKGEQVERTYTTPLLDKLGVKPGMRVAVIDVADQAFRDQLAERTPDLTDGWPAAATDLVFLGADTIDELLRIGRLQARLKPNGAIWVISSKGKQATVRDIDVIEAARAVGLVDNKVASFSPTHTALRLVIPVARRADRAAKGNRA